VGRYLVANDPWPGETSSTHVFRIEGGTPVWERKTGRSEVRPLGEAHLLVSSDGEVSVCAVSDGAEVWRGKNDPPEDMWTHSDLAGGYLLVSKGAKTQVLQVLEDELAPEGAGSIAPARTGRIVALASSMSSEVSIYSGKGLMRTFHGFAAGAPVWMAESVMLPTTRGVLKLDRRSGRVEWSSLYPSHELYLGQDYLLSRPALPSPERIRQLEKEGSHDWLDWNVHDLADGRVLARMMIDPYDDFIPLPDELIVNQGGRVRTYRIRRSERASLPDVRYSVDYPLKCGGR
jgi:hypothetical protein